MHRATNQHARANGQITQSDVRLRQEGVLLSERARDRRGDAVPHGVDDGGESERERDGGVEEEREGVADAGAFRGGCWGAGGGSRSGGLN